MTLMRQFRTTTKLFTRSKLNRWLQLGAIAALTVTGIATGTVSTGAESQPASSPPKAAPPPKLVLRVAPAQRPSRLSPVAEGYVPAGLAVSTNPSGTRNVFGTDDRLPMMSRLYPWSTIGRVDIYDASNKFVGHCTGTLIGKRLVLTNAHCAVDANGTPHTWLRFRPNLRRNVAQDEAFAVKGLVGTKNPGRDRSADWALLVLDRPLGETYGWMGWAATDFANANSFKQRLILAGYSGDFPADQPKVTAGVHQGCSIRGLNPAPGLLSHDCDMTRGASGGPIFALVNKKAVIMALNAAYRIAPGGEQVPDFSEDVANLGVAATNWAGFARELQVQNP